MKYIKKFEYRNNKFNVGDYVIAKKLMYSGPLKNVLENTVGIIKNTPYEGDNSTEYYIIEYNIIDDEV